MATRERPLSPHLQVYRWQIQMASSILHRITGIYLSVGGIAIALALVAIAAGPDAWAQVHAVSGAWYGLLFLFGWTWSFAYHLLNGIRHLAQDAGYGFSIPAFIRNGWLSVLGSLLLTAAVWWAAMSGGAA